MREMLDRVERHISVTLEEMVADNIRICEIPAPSYYEEKRAMYVAARLRSEGVQNVHIDEVFNVHGVIAGFGGKKIMLAAHMDTVFPLDTDVSVRREADRLFAPGIRDNSTGVAALICLARLIRELSLVPPGDLILVATTCEEGLGDLRGMKKAMERHQGKIDYVIAIDGVLGNIVHLGIASRRLKIVVNTPGGHSWGDFGVPSAIHSLAKIIAKIAEVKVRTDPRTTYNVGVIKGGTSVNTIAAHAEMLLDMRSTSRSEVEQLERKMRDIIENEAIPNRLAIEIEVVGDRPGGSIESSHPLVDIAKRALQLIGVEGAFEAGSTDANVPLGLGIPAICIGITEGEGAHRYDEFLKISPMIKGMVALFATVWGAASR
ncbi:MAG: M20/M25/M40 family metallo-hydrolase [bacterium]|nr:M20/M25/M40 family metallo-hydrolase [bacterium]